MPRSIYPESSPELAVITDKTSFYDQKEIDPLMKRSKLRVADMPLLIRSMVAHPEIRRAIRPHEMIYTLSGECHGRRSGKHFYEVWHSVGPHVEIRKYFRDIFGFTLIPDDAWTSMGNGQYKGKSVARLHLDDIKRGDTPVPGTPYTIFVRWDKDACKIHSTEKLSYDQFMLDDRILMVTGSSENREALAKMLFDSKEEGGEGWSNVSSNLDYPSNPNALGRLLLLKTYYNGLGGGNYMGSFVGVGVGGES